jgi:elongator complex protein 3
VDVSSLTSDEALRDIIANLSHVKKPTRDDLARLKMRAAAKYNLNDIPSNSQLVAVLSESERKRFLPILRRKATRTISGVTVIAVMTKPYPCPQPSPCHYCPGGPSIGVPQSYTGFEPAAMRGLQNQFDAYRQVKSRMEQLTAIGHDIDKVELIVMGGTFPASPKKYQSRFIQRCLDGICGMDSSCLDEAKKNAETSRIRNVGITVETRPDWAKKAQVDRMLQMGVTRVELGIQNPSDRIYKLVGRKHKVQDVVEATRVMKDAGLKIVYHMMPGLPGTTPEMDLEAFEKIFSDERFKPDMIKIYPCLVVKGTKVHEWYVAGTYRPYSTEQAAGVIVEVKKIVPQWVRIMRIQRDIPLPHIIAGVDKSNLRQIVQERLKQKGIMCRCIRCREVGHNRIESVTVAEPSISRIHAEEYDASEGKEVFISAEDETNDTLIGYLRLRIPSEKAHRPEIAKERCSIVRELHVYGSLVPVGKHSKGAWQHKGYGSVLLSEAERISEEDYGLRRILVISALGTKQYYKRHGYDYDGVYVSKALG